jgi:hypothetical protein
LVTYQLKSYTKADKIKVLKKIQKLYTCASGFTARASMAPSASANESLTADTLSSKPYIMLSDKEQIQLKTQQPLVFSLQWTVDMRNERSKQYLNTTGH